MQSALAEARAANAGLPVAQRELESSVAGLREARAARWPILSAEGDLRYATPSSAFPDNGSEELSSFVAAIMMVGIAGENSVFVIHEARLGLRRGAAVQDAWAEASRRRLRPVAMTVIATGLALAPLALGVGQGALLIQPLAIGVIGGFAISAPLVLLALPGLYALLDPRGRLGAR